MKPKKRVNRKKSFLASHKLLVLVVIFLSIPLTLYLAQNQQRVQLGAQQAITPTFFCQGSCPTPSDTDQVPMTTPNANPTSTGLAPTSVLVQPSQAPCPEDAGASLADHRERRSSEGLFEKLLKFILELFEKLIAFFTGKGGNFTPPDSPAPTEKPEEPNNPEEPEEPEPSTEPEPSAAPCDPVVTQEPEEPEPTTPPATPGPTKAPAPAPNPNVPVPPTTDTCGAKYRLTNPRKQNFGDPKCDFDKNKLFAQLKQIDPANASIWFNEVVPCESSYNPNAYAPPSTGTPDAGGAWGLFQMGQGKNGKFDHGDVVWGMQASNAVNYNKTVIKGNWRYWSCAKSHWK